MTIVDRLRDIVRYSAKAGVHVRQLDLTPQDFSDLVAVMNSRLQTVPPATCCGVRDHPQVLFARPDGRTYVVLWAPWGEVQVTRGTT